MKNEVCLFYSQDSRAGEVQVWKTLDDAVDYLRDWYKCDECRNEYGACICFPEKIGECKRFSRYILGPFYFEVVKVRQYEAAREF